MSFKCFIQNRHDRKPAPVSATAQVEWHRMFDGVRYKAIYVDMVSRTVTYEVEQ